MQLRQLISMILIVSTAESFDINAVFAPLHKLCALSRQSGFYMVMSFGNLKRFLNSVQKRMEIEMYILWKNYKWKLDQNYNGILSLTQLTSIVLMIAFLKRLISKPRFLIRLTLRVPSCSTTWFYCSLSEIEENPNRWFKDWVLI